MSNFISVSELNSSNWLAVVTCDGSDGMGEVLGYCFGEAEDSVCGIPRGELFDALDLFMDGGDVPDDVSVEYCTAEEFWDSYGDRMPLGNNGFQI